MKGLFALVEVITAPSSVLDAGIGAGAERTGGGDIIFFLPGFSFLSISGAGRQRDVVVSHWRKGSKRCTVCVAANDDTDE